jgi:hypothetical protein
VFVADCVEHDARPEARAILANSPAFGFVFALARGGLECPFRQAGGAILLGEEAAKMLADDFRRLIALDAFAPGVPAGDDPFRIEHIDRVIDDGLHQQAKISFGPFALLRFMADVGEKLRPQHLERREFIAKPDDLPLVRLLLRDVAAFERDEGDLAMVILDRCERGVDDEGVCIVSVCADRRIPANELALTGTSDLLSQSRAAPVRSLPPERRPERLPLDVGEPQAPGIERGLIDIEDGAVSIEQGGELHHRVERDPRKLFAVSRSRVTG